ncbi:hypothetical protein ONZ43_g704 [Nemania bipapillata]|uniref:Uncharacterized protein n=1 Tax=Nemania bipapillata TaxID=110536 RepID=A0ACC2J7E6_9PEZI|nr:hypothetical protein ONZ43_g704 [Nemania bipapillata]
MTLPRTRKWYEVRWYSDEDTKEDRKLIIRLDILIVPYAVLSYWVKYLDQANLNNAYVAGLKEDLGFYGNELVQLQTFYVVGSVLGNLPFIFLLTYVPMYYLLPGIDVAWGIFTLLQFRTTSFAELAAYRFLVGLFEAPFFAAMHYVFGSWYRGDEIARRGGIFYIGLPLGSLTAGLIQSAASSTLEDVHGLASWRWMYIICAAITIPIGLLGYLVLPGTPDLPNRKVLRQQDVELAISRLHRFGHVSHEKFKWRTAKKVLLTWHFWTILLMDTLFWNAAIHGNTTGSFLLWIKSLGRYSDSRVTELGTIAPAFGIFYTLVVCFASDLLIGPAWAITVATVWNIIGLVILVIWNVPESALWFAFSTVYAAVSLSSVLHGWINTQLRSSPAARSFTLVLVTSFTQSTTIWTPLLTFKTVEAPRFPKGFPFCLACAVLLLVVVHGLNSHLKRAE